MIINTKTKELNDNKNIYKLTDLEYKFIVSISNENLTSFNKIQKYMFKSTGYKEKLKMMRIKNRLLKKVTELQIKIKTNNYQLETKILFM